MSSNRRPSLPSDLSRMTPRERRDYNRWAVQNGEPPLPAAPVAVPAASAAAAPAAAAPARPAGVIATAVQNGARARFNAAAFRWEHWVRGGRKYILTRQDGSLTCDGAQYSEVARRMGLQNFQLDSWRDGMRMLDGSNADVAYDVSPLILCA